MTLTLTFQRAKSRIPLPGASLSNSRTRLDQSLRIINGSLPKYCGKNQKSGIVTKWRTIPACSIKSTFSTSRRSRTFHSKGQAKIHHFNVKVTRQEPSENAGASSKANKAKLEAKFKTALSSLYEAFEEAYQFEQPEFIAELRNHLVKAAVTQMTSLFASSRCRSCYRGRRMDAAWRRMTF